MNVTPANYYSTVRAAVESRVAAQWVDGGGQPPSVISWPDVPFTVPTNAAWLKVSILFGDSFPTTICGNGSGLNRNVGSIQLQVYVPKGRGTGAQLDTLAGTARGIFSRFSGSGLLCGATRDANDPVTSGAWLVKTVTTPFEVQEYVTI